MGKNVRVQNVCILIFGLKLECSDCRLFMHPQRESFSCQFSISIRNLILEPMFLSEDCGEKLNYEYPYDAKP